MERILGVDVSKDYLDLDTLPATEKRRLTNDPAGIAELVEWARAFGPDRIVFESTGHYQKAAVGALLAVRLSVRTERRRRQSGGRRQAPTESCGGGDYAGDNMPGLWEACCAGEMQSRLPKRNLPRPRDHELLRVLIVLASAG